MSAQQQSSPPAATPHVLAVDDDSMIRELMVDYLGQNGFRITAVADGKAMQAVLAAEVVDLIVLDLTLQAEDGMAIARRMRDESAIPIIMLTGRRDEADRVMGLELGADDYLTKPFSPRALIARARAILRRADARTDSTLKAGITTLDVARHVLRSGPLDVQLTPLETLLLRSLMKTPGRTVNTDRLVSDAWGRTGAEERHALKQVIYRLRRKLEEHDVLANRLQTLRNAGYRWDGGEPAAVAPSHRD